jgi:hypothetical protein
MGHSRLCGESSVRVFRFAFIERTVTGSIRLGVTSMAWPTGIGPVVTGTWQSEPSLGVVSVAI